jgi:hypothetical protein
VNNRRIAVALASFPLVLACSLEGGENMSYSSETSGDPSGENSPDETTDDSSGAESAESSEDDSGASDGPILDIGGTGDPDDPTPPTGEVPATCEDAEAAPTAFGCEFFAVDLDNRTDSVPYGIAISNLQEEAAADFEVQVLDNGIWSPIDSGTIESMDVAVAPLPDLAQDGSGKKSEAVYRVVSEVPVLAYQFNPMDQGVFTTDASLLLPLSSWDHHYTVLGWETSTQSQPAYVTITASVDGTEVEVTPTVATAAGPGVPSGVAGQPFTLTLDAGDVAEFTTAAAGPSLSGTQIKSDEDHPIGVFSGHECANIPAQAGYCDHLEEQLVGSQAWGKHYVAARVPVRDTFGNPEETLWQIVGRDDGTVVNFDAPDGVTGLPEQVQLDAGEVVEYWVTGPQNSPGDFEVNSNRPIGLMNYMTGATNLAVLQPGYGDPAAVQIAPVEQFLPRYSLSVPDGFTLDFLVLTRPQGHSLSLDGSPVPDEIFHSVGAGWEVGRIEVVDGTHTLEGDGETGFGVSVVGYEEADSYAYLGGLGLAPINPIPVD